MRSASQIWRQISWKWIGTQWRVATLQTDTTFPFAPIDSPQPSHVSPRLGRTQISTACIRGKRPLCRFKRISRRTAAWSITLYFANHRRRINRMQREEFPRADGSRARWRPCKRRMPVKRAQILTDRNAGEVPENFRKSARGLRAGSGGLDLALPRHHAPRVCSSLASWRETASPVHPYSRVGVAGSLISGFSRIVVAPEHIDTDRMDPDDRAEL